jgi:hypothetical protein
VLSYIGVAASAAVLRSGISFAAAPPIGNDDRGALGIASGYPCHGRARAGLRGERIRAIDQTDLATRFGLPSNPAARAFAFGPPGAIVNTESTVV